MGEKRGSGASLGKPLSAEQRLAALDGWAAGLTLCLRQVQARQRSQRRTIRLEAILKIAAKWTQHLEMETLLLQMAETSTKLLNAERASIFLGTACVVN